MDYESPCCRTGRDCGIWNSNFISTIDWVKWVKAKLFFILFLILGFLGTNHYAFSQSMTPPKTLTLLYSNNINGEIDPCPT